ncbi:hypothetical protein F4860DRAFT_198742 [Xylaria cubensis]|nr:hypothetical protein F4860DRAFT_198742 [Xylaria cubensis]
MRTTFVTRIFGKGQRLRISIYPQREGWNCYRWLPRHFATLCSFDRSNLLTRLWRYLLFGWTQQRLTQRWRKRLSRWNQRRGNVGSRSHVSSRSRHRRGVEGQGLSRRSRVTLTCNSRGSRADHLDRPTTGLMERHARGERNWEGFGPDLYLAGVAMSASVTGI